MIGLLIVWFFRDPPRRIPTEAGLVVSPADGKVVAIDEIEHDEFLGGPAVQIGIFLSIFNVHINRAPVAGRVIGVRYRPGKFLNALRPESARENEQTGRPDAGDGGPVPPIRRPPDHRGDRPADRLLAEARRRAGPRRAVRHDQARLADRTGAAPRGGA